MISLQDLVKARVHFGHRTSRWCPKMAPYIWGQKNDIHLIDIAKTASLLDRAARFLESIAAEGKTILWVGTKKVAQDCIKTVAIELDNPCVTHRWIGGTLTNYPQVKKSVTKLLHLEDIIEKSDQFNYTKKELNKFQKNIGRLRANVGGISTMQWPVGALVVVDIHKEHAAIREAIRSNVPVVALVDTNADPSDIDYIIPANDDAVSSITFVVNYLKNAVLEGQKQAKDRKKDQSEESIQEKVEVEEIAVDSDENDNESAKIKQSSRKKQPKEKSVKSIKKSEDSEEFEALAE